MNIKYKPVNIKYKSAIDEIWNKWHKFYIDSLTPYRKGIHSIHYEVFVQIAEPVLRKLKRKKT